MDSDIMDDSALDDYQEESDAYSPDVKPKAKAPAKKPAAAKSAAAKPAATKKKMTQTTLTGAKPASKKRPKTDSDDEDAGDGNLLDTPPSAKKQKKAPAKKQGGKPLAEIENDSMVIDDEPAKPKSKKSATETYQKLTQLEHIIKRPDTYIGSTERTDSKMWVFNKTENLMENRTVSFVPGLYKIFDEILVNAADNKQRDATMTYLKVAVDRTTGTIMVENNGKAIPVEMHAKENCYIPELVFGHLLSGSNYDDNEKKTVGGRNGYGAKLCNVFSTEFSIEVQDSTNGKRYKQTWSENMSKMDKAKITSNKTSDFVRVTFHPDYERFGMPDGIDDDLEALIYRRIYDMAGTIEGVKVHLNGEQLKVDFKKYCEMYAVAIAKERGDDPGLEEGGKPAAASVIFEEKKAHRRWQIGFTVSDGSFQQVSFVNNIATTSGGTHVGYIADQICDALLKDLNKKKKGHTLKMNHIRNHIFIFVNCLIENPAFTSQTKEQLTTKASAFGSQCVLTDGFLKKIRATEAINNIMQFADQKADKLLAKSDGNKRSRISNDKLVDANLAGSKHGHECTLILTEGDSAKGLAISGRAVLDPDRIGVFPLRGKLLNVRDASLDAILKNKELQNIKQFLGLKHKQVYTDTKGLRYGHLMIMADQDHDGSHIKGLLINFLAVQFPSLLKIPDFFREFITPVVKVWQGANPKKPMRLKSFFTMPQYEEWKLLHSAELRRWQYKYFKGLGTSSPDDAKVYFSNLDEHLKEFNTMSPQEAELFDLAFSKKKADARKEWLGSFVPGTYLDHSVKTITYDDFVNKELILFSMADNLRSIPSVIDGFKPGQRKVMHACFKRNLVKDKKVVELAGYVSEQTAYHHGEQSLQQTIVGLAQTFVGSNNVNCLEPSGNFGSRLAGGADAASARYIHTRLSPFARRVFNPLDEPNLDYQFEDGKMIEPKVFAPVIPMVLVNGADGIGTGWSTSIPNYHPMDIVKNIKRRMGRLDPEDPEEKPFEIMVPWFRGWKGAAEPDGPSRYKFNGIATWDEAHPNEVSITELPIRVWTDDFKAKLEEIIRGEKSPSFIKDYKEFNDHNTVHFIIQMEDKHVQAALKDGLLEKFKLLKSLGTTNLVAFNTNGQIQKYNSPEEILEEFYNYRFMMYTERKAHWLRVFDLDYRKLKNQYRFIQEIIDGKLVVYRKKKTVIVQELRDRKYEAFPPKIDLRKSKSTDEELDADGDEEAEEEVEAEAGAESTRDFDYLLSLPIYALTSERLERLQSQIDSRMAEIDELSSKSEKDLWCADLDAFVEEWDSQMRLDLEIKTTLRRMGRRVSKKIGAGAGGGRGRRKDDDEYDPVVKKARGPAKNAAKSAVKEAKVEEKTHMRFTEKFSAKAKPKKLGGLDGAEDDDLSDDDFSALGKTTSKPAEPAASTATEAAGGRSKRAAAVKPKTYVLDDDSDDDDDDDFLNLGKPAAAPKAAPAPKEAAKEPVKEDSVQQESAKEDSVKEDSAKEESSAAAAISLLSDSEDEQPPKPAPASRAAEKPTKRVAASKKKPVYAEESSESEDDDDKMLGNIGDMVKGIGGSSTTASNGRLSLFAMSRPDLGHDTSALPKLKSKQSKSTFDFDSHDDTNYEALAMSSPRKSTKPDDMDDDDDDDDFPAVSKVATKASSSQAAASSSKAKAPLSVVPPPAAKKARGRPAAAKTKAKDADAPAPAKTKAKTTKAKEKTTTLSPAAKAYAAKKAKARPVVSDDEDDFDQDIDMVDAAPPSPVAKPRARPGRAAAAKAKPIIIPDEDDDEDEFASAAEDKGGDDDESDAFAMDDDSE